MSHSLSLIRHNVVSFSRSASLIVSLYRLDLRRRMLPNLPLIVFVVAKQESCVLQIPDCLEGVSQLHRLD